MCDVTGFSRLRHNIACNAEHRIMVSDRNLVGCMMNRLSDLKLHPAQFYIFSAGNVGEWKRLTVSQSCVKSLEEF